MLIKTLGYFIQNISTTTYRILTQDNEHFPETTMGIPAHYPDDEDIKQIKIGNNVKIEKMVDVNDLHENEIDDNNVINLE